MLQRISSALQWLSEFVDDIDEWLGTQDEWADIRAVRDLPPTAEFPHISTADRPFGLPADADDTQHRRIS